MVNIHERKGFTLIELLVIIIIIGLLAVAIIVSLNSARAKARDAKRISDIKQMSKLLETQEASTSNSNLTGCNAAAADRNVTRCTGPGDISQFNTLNFVDPSGSTTICNSVTTYICQYSIRQVGGNNRPTTSDYEICFYLENSVVGVPNGNGLKRIINGSGYQNGCQ